jgi:uncharacterized membrane protein YqjE
MSEAHGDESGGLFSALRNISSVLLASGKTRLELLGNEIEEEKLRLVELFLMAQGMAFCFGVGILIVIFFFTALFWESRLLVLGAAAALFLVFGGIFYTRFKRAAGRPDRVFAASIAELQEDLRQLKAAVGHEPPA